MLVVATPYLAAFYAEHPLFQSLAFLAGPLMVMTAITNMVFATLKTVARAEVVRSRGR